VPFIQEVSGVYTSPFLDTDELKMALQARKVSGAFEKRAPGPGFSEQGPVSRKPRQLFGPAKACFVNWYLKTEGCIRLKLLE